MKKLFKNTILDRVLDFGRGLGRGQRGSVVTEFAISFPILITVTLMVFDIGRAMFVYTTIHNVAAEGARYISVRGTGSPTQTSAADHLAFMNDIATGLDPAQMNVVILYTPAPTSGSEVKVTITYSLTFFGSVFLPIEAITMTSESKMTVL